MTDELPPRQQQILEVLLRARREGKPVPTIREIGEAIGLRSHSTIHYHLLGLADRGLIRWHRGLNRAIEIVDAPAEFPCFTATCVCGAKLTAPIGDVGEPIQPVDCACGHSLYVSARVVERRPDGSVAVGFRSAELAVRVSPYIPPVVADGASRQLPYRRGE